MILAFDVSNETIIRTVQEFKSEGDIILLSFTEYDKWKDPGREEMEEKCLKDYISNRSHLTQKCREDIDRIVEADGSENMEECSESAICEIKKFLYDKDYITELKEYPEEIREFVEERKMFISEEWDFPEGTAIIERPKFYTRDIWFRVDEDDLRWWMDKYSSFIGLIIKDGGELEEYRYFFRYGEKGENMVLEGYESRMVREEGFYNIIMEIVSRYEDTYEGDLVTYLLNIWNEIKEKKEEDMSKEFFFEVIENGFKGDGKIEDLPEDWRRNEKPLDFFNPDFKGIERFKKVLLFQIADAVKIKEEELEDKFPYSEIISPTGNRWDNYKVTQYLECGARGITDAFGGAIYEWKDFGAFLEMGRMYE